jgi:hypothetical protein
MKERTKVTILRVVLQRLAQSPKETLIDNISQSDLQCHSLSFLSSIHPADRSQSCLFSISSWLKNAHPLLLDNSILLPTLANSLAPFVARCLFFKSIDDASTRDCPAVVRRRLNTVPACRWRASKTSKNCRHQSPPSSHSRSFSPSITQYINTGVRSSSARRAFRLAPHVSRP